MPISLNRSLRPVRLTLERALCINSSARHFVTQRPQRQPLIEAFSESSRTRANHLPLTEWKSRCLRRYASGNTSQLASKISKKTAAGTSSIPASICPVDTILPGVNYFKGQPPVVALADEEYPEWLWTILEPKVLEDDGPGGKFERAKRRAANRQAIKDRNFMLTQ